MNPLSRRALGGAALGLMAAPVAAPARAGTPLHQIAPTRGLVHRLHQPRRVALVVVDMQNFFIEPDQPRPGLYVPGVIPRIQALIEAVRAAGGVVAWTRHTGGDGPGEAAPAWFDDFIGPVLAEQVRTELRPGRRAHRIHADLDVRPDDIVIDKFRFSGFVRTDLHDRLSARGVDTLIVAGTVTNYCCQGTARDGMLLDYRVLMPPDATAAASDAIHNATYADLGHMGVFDLRRSADVIDDLRRASS